MRVSQTRCRPFLGFLSALVLLAGAPVAGAKAADCEDVVDEGGSLTVLTLNLLFSEVRLREERFRHIAEFLRVQAVDGDPVDLILLQEVVGGYLAWSEFTNSARRLNEMISELEVEGLEYNLRTAFEVGLPGLFYTGNAILSRCEIKFSRGVFLPRLSCRRAGF